MTVTNKSPLCSGPLRSSRPSVAGCGDARNLRWSPDDERIAVGAADHVAIYDTLDGRELQRLRGNQQTYYYAMDWSPEGRMLIAGEGVLYDFDAESGTEQRMYAGRPHGYTHGNVSAVSWTSDAQAIYCGNGHSGARRWTPQDEDPVWNLDSPPAEDPLRYGMLALSPDEQQLAVGTLRNGIELFETDPPRRTKKLSGNLSSVQDLHWTPEGRLWSVHGVPTAKCELVCWDTERGVPIRRTPLPPELGLAVFSPGGDRVATVTDSGQVQLFETTTGQPLGTFIPFEWGGNLVVSPAGHYWATPELQDELVYVVHSDTGQRMLTPDEFATQYGWQNDPHRVHGFEPMAVPR